MGEVHLYEAKKRVILPPAFDAGLGVLIDALGYSFALARLLRD